MVYKWYILPIGGLYATYHLLGEPEATIDFLANFVRASSSQPFCLWILFGDCYPMTGVMQWDHFGGDQKIDGKLKVCSL